MDGHTVRNGTAGAVDVELDVLVRVLGFQVQQLSDHQRGGGGVHILTQKDDTVIEKTGENVIGPFSAAGLLYYIRY
jgi:hypothetical protein